MAAGGIAVSGGKTGYGTLISTNLLYSPLLYDTSGNLIARPAPTIGGTAGATGFEAAFAIDRDPATLWKTASLDVDITYTIDLGVTNLTVYGAAVIGHNIPTTGLTHALLEGGTTNSCGDVSQALTLNADTYTPGYHLLGTPVTKRYWRSNVHFAAATALQFGEFFLIGAAPLVFERNFRTGFTPNLELGAVSSSGISGVPRIYTRWERLRYEFEFYNISLTQLTALQLAARNGHVVFSPYGTDGAAYYGTLELQRPKNVAAKSFSDSTYSVEAVFTEAAK